MTDHSRDESKQQLPGQIPPELLINTLCCPIYYQYTNGTYAGCNADFANRIVGLAIDDIVGKTPVDLKDNLPAELVEMPFEEELESIHLNGPMCREVTLLFTDGRSGRFAVHKSLFMENPDQAAGIVGIMLDMTDANVQRTEEIQERRQAGSESISNQERYRRIFENSGTATILVEPDLTISMANARAEKLIGIPRRQFVGRAKSLDFVVPEHRERLKLYHELRLQGDPDVPRRFEFQSQDVKGQIKDILSSVEYIPETQQVVVSMLDITRSNQINKERRRLAAVIDQSTEAVIITDTHGKVEYINKAFEALSGYDRLDCIGQNMDAPFFSDKDRAILKKMTFMTSAEDTWSGRIENQSKEGRHYITDTRFFPICNAKGSAVNLVCVKRDVTHEVQIEKQLQHAQKMEAIGTLAGGIAHDFNNILGGILGYAEICKLNAGPGEQVHRYLGRILDGCQRAKELVANILAFSRKENEEAKPIEVQTIVKEAMKLLRASIPSSVEFNQQISSQPGIVIATPTQVHQIIMNLCTNAAQAMQDAGGELNVSLNHINLSLEDCADNPRLAPGPYVCLTVSDTGPGMSAALADRIFEPYFTTKAQKGGTGLGLSVVHGIVKNIGGDLSVASQPGKGSAFKVYLPRAEEQAPTPVAPQEDIPKGTETILVVDDELFILEIMSDMLHAAGYKIEAMDSSADALQLFQEDPDRFDLVIADHTMPKITGKVLAKKIKTIRPAMPIVLTTGLVFDDATAKETLSDFVAILKKPILYKDLATTLRKVLDDPISKQ